MMKTKEELRVDYILAQTKGWDSETKEKYISNVEEDFEVWYKGYLSALKELANKTLPVLEFTKGRLNSEAGLFQQAIESLIIDLQPHV